MSQVTIRRPFGELDLGDQLRFELQQFFISSSVKAHWVRFFSGRLPNGQVSVASPLNLVAHVTSKLRYKPVPHLRGV